LRSGKGRDGTSTGAAKSAIGTDKVTATNGTARLNCKNRRRVTSPDAVASVSAKGGGREIKAASS